MILASREAPPSMRLQAALASVFIGAWMAAGWLLALPPNAYLVLGVPLVLAYQLVILHRPVRALWRFDGAPLGFDRSIVTVGLMLATWPALSLVASFVTSARVGVDVAAWCLCAAVGAFGLAWWLVNAWRQPQFWRGGQQPAFFALVVVTGVMLFALSAWMSGARPHLPPATGLATFISDAWLYACVCFVLEEVVFRGAIDPAIVPDAPVTGLRAHATAVFVSLLWGAWHFPLLPFGHGSIHSMASTLAFHVGVGWPMTLLARRARNLGPTCLAHAAIDAFRDVITSV
ncbi:MAG TPA: CPBP family intramembrane glutamic endopeptidase [Burkholderiaceae bacterium]